MSRSDLQERNHLFIFIGNFNDQIRLGVPSSGSSLNSSSSSSDNSNESQRDQVVKTSSQPSSHHHGIQSKPVRRYYQSFNSLRIENVSEGYQREEERQEDEYWSVKCETDHDQLWKWCKKVRMGNPCKHCSIKLS